MSERETGARLTRYIGAISSVAGRASQFCMVLLILLVTAAVVARYFFHAPLLFGDEYSGYLLVWIVFLGAAATLKENGHVSIDLLTERLSRKTRLKLRIFSFAVSLACFAVITWQSYRLVSYSYSHKVTALGALDTPHWIPQMVIPIGWFVMCLQLIAMILLDAAALSKGSVEANSPDANQGGLSSW